MRAPDRLAIVETVLRRLASDAEPVDIGNWMYRVGSNAIVHVRLHCPTASTSGKFRFDLNPNSLSADYEVWICGDVSKFYLIPQHVIARLYNDPAHYTRERYPRIHPVHVDVAAQEVRFARPGKKERIAEYFNRILSGHG